MKNLKFRIFIPVVIVASMLLGAFVHFQSGVSNSSVNASGYASLTPLQKRLLSGVMVSEVSSVNTPDLKGKPRNYFPTSDDGCPQSRGSNIKVNQNCLNLSDLDLQGRGQANNETAIAQDPNNPQHIIAGDNDYRRGDSTCGVAYSLNSGQSWTDSAIPIGFTRGTAFGGVARQYWQASGDPSIAWDTRGNAYYSC